MANMEVKRSTAVKIRIGELVSGKYEKQEGMSPNYVLTPEGRKISRAWVTGTVVGVFRSEDGNYSSVTVDDSTGVIRAKAFGGLKTLEGIEKGDIADIIGKVREYNGEIHMIPETARKIDFKTGMMRDLEKALLLKKWKEKKKVVNDLKRKTADIEELKRVAFERYGIPEDEVDGIIGAETPAEEPGQDEKQMLMKLIEKMDAGEGASYSDLLEASGLSEERFDELMTLLLEEGMCYEPRPGKIKKL